MGHFVGTSAGGKKKMEMREAKRHIDARISAGLLPGAVCGVFRNGKCVFEYVSGYSDVENRGLLQRNAVFRLASMTKPVTAAAVLFCEDRGLLRTDEPVSKYLPDFGKMHVGRFENGILTDGGRAEREITLKDILTHSAGLGSGEVGEYQYTRRSVPRTLTEAAETYGKWYLDFSPGSKQYYSAAVAFDILARIVEVVSGTPYAEFLYKNIFLPLGMKDTTYAPDGELLSRTVSMYRLKEDGRGMEKCDFGRSGFHEFAAGYTGGSAGLFGTFDDYSRFARMLEGGGKFDGVRVLSEKAVKKMRTPALSHEMNGIDDYFNWGLGVRVREKRGATQPLSSGSFGWSGAFNTHFWVDPQLSLVGLLMSNLKDAGGADSPTAIEFERDVMAEITRTEAYDGN